MKKGISGYLSDKPMVPVTRRPRPMTPEQVEEAARRDPDNPPLTKEQLSKMKRVKK